MTYEAPGPGEVYCDAGGTKLPEPRLVWTTCPRCGQSIRSRMDNRVPSHNRRLTEKERADRLPRLESDWEPYGRCGYCSAAPGRPCMTRTTAKYIARPHPGRPLRSGVPS